MKVIVTSIIITLLAVFAFFGFGGVVNNFWQALVALVVVAIISFLTKPFITPLPYSHRMRFLHNVIPHTCALFRGNISVVAIKILFRLLKNLHISLNQAKRAKLKIILFQEMQASP